MFAAHSGDERLQNPNPEPNEGDHQYSEQEIQEIALHLAKEEQPLWSENPRLFIILRDMNRIPGINGPHITDKFVNNGINDTWLPILSKSLDTLLPPLARPHFLCAQSRVCGQPSEFKLGFRSAHGHFPSKNSAPFARRRVIGFGRVGEVDEVWSLVDRQIYARKVIHRPWRNFTSTNKSVRSFRRELKALRRIDHMHCVKFVSTHLCSLPSSCCTMSLWYSLAMLSALILQGPKLTCFGPRRLAVTLILGISRLSCHPWQIVIFDNTLNMQRHHLAHLPRCGFRSGSDVLPQQFNTYTRSRFDIEI